MYDRNSTGGCHSVLYRWHPFCFYLDAPVVVIVNVYNIDSGAEPGFVLSKAESFYDRPALVEYINSLK